MPKIIKVTKLRCALRVTQSSNLHIFALKRKNEIVHLEFRHYLVDIQIILPHLCMHAGQD